MSSSLARYWAEASHILAPFGESDLADTANFWHQLTSLLEPNYPSTIDANTQQVRHALQALARNDGGMALTSKEANYGLDLIKNSLATWYIARCQVKFDLVCDRILEPLRDMEEEQNEYSVQETVLQVFEALSSWLQSWTTPFMLGQVLDSEKHARQLTSQLHTQLGSHVNESVILSIRRFLTYSLYGANSDRLAVYANVLGLSATVLTLLTDVIHSEVSRKVRASVDGQNLTEQDEVWEMEEPARDRLNEWLDTQVKPRFQSITDVCTDRSVDLSDPADRLVEEEFADEGTWESRLDYQLDRTLCEVRAKQLFDLIAIYPDSIAALQDLRVSLARTDDKLIVARSLSNSLQSRLLHPGAHTRDIIQIYVHMVRALREVDSSGVVLSRVVSPLRRYLRARKDTIAVIVSSLLGDDPSFTLLKDELEGADQEEQDDEERGTGSKRLRDRRSLGTSGQKKQKRSDDASNTDDSDEDWFDPDWHPKPVDAGPGYRLSTSRDVIGMLISIFDDRQGFIDALEKSMADQLVRVKGYKAMREYRNNMILKKRFGEKNMGKCDVMLGDVTESRRIDCNVHARVGGEVVDALHPLIMSRQFWPEEVSKAKEGMGSLPPRMQEAAEQYQKAFVASKAMRRLEWLHQLGSVEIEITTKDGRETTVECSVLQASVIELASHSNVVSVEKVVEQLGVRKREDVVEALAFWSRMGVLKELIDVPDSYEVIETAEDEEEEGDHV